MGWFWIDDDDDTSEKRGTLEKGADAIRSRKKKQQQRLDEIMGQMPTTRSKKRATK